MAFYKNGRKLITRTIIAIVSILILFVVPVVLPGHFFAWTVNYANLTLASNRYFDLDSGRNILKQVESKLTKSTFYDYECQRQSNFAAGFLQRTFTSLVHARTGRF